MENKSKFFDKFTTSVILISGIILLGTVIIFGCSYAYYVAKVSGEGKAISATAGVLKITYTESSAINLSAAKPINDSDKATKSAKNVFTVANTAAASTFNANYNVQLTVTSIANELKSNLLKWELVKGGTVLNSGNFSNVSNNTVVNLNSTPIALAKGATDSLELRIWLSYSTTVDQKNMLGKTLTGKIKVTSYQTN